MNAPLVLLELKDQKTLIEEIKKLGIHRIYREIDGATADYTAWSATENIFIKSRFIYPELAKLLGQTYPLGRNSWNHGHWNIENDAAYVTYRTKKEFLNCLKLLGVDKKIISSIRAMSKEELNKMTEQAKLEQSKNQTDEELDETPFLLRVIEANALDGIINKIMMSIETDYSSSFTINIENWAEAQTKMTEKYEKDFTEQGIIVVPGKITIHGN